MFKYKNIVQCNVKKYFNILRINMICTMTSIFHNLIKMITFHDTNIMYRY
jgi:hypothetical protein